MQHIRDQLLRETIKAVKSFTEDIYNDLSNEQNVGAQKGYRKGQLVLSIEYLNRQAEITESLHEAVRGKGRDVWSYESVENLFEKALYSALSIDVPTTSDFNDRLAIAIKELNESLRAPLTKWELVFPVMGLMAPNEAFEIGNVKLSNSTPENLKALIDRISHINNGTAHDDEEKQAFNAIFDQQVHRVFDELGIASVCVWAAESRAATTNAKLDVIEVLDILNFFSIALYPRDLRVRIHLPSEARGVRSEHLSFNGIEKFNMHFSNQGPIQNFDLKSFDEETLTRIGLTQLRMIFAKPQKNELDRSIITATRIAGKANVALRKEDSFLLYAIAVESVIVGGDEKTDLTYKLSTRCAHLLGQDLTSRLRIKDEIKTLYGIRSGIVHRGLTNFPDEDLFQLRRYALSVIRSFLVNDEFREITKKADLSSWFDKRMLA